MKSQKTRPIESVTDWLGVSEAPNWGVARPLGIIFGAVVALLFVLAVVTAFAVLVRMLFSEGEISLGAGALVTALLGAPFLIWGTILKHQTVMFQKEGHMTDRINKAVEQLGSEKTVERIGRPITIWTGERDAVMYPVESLPTELGVRTKVGQKEYRETWEEEESEVHEGYWCTVTTWADETTLIQWQGEELNVAPQDVIGRVGDWQVFKESVPNVEVRIGAILSLERISQDSTRHDHGRDHVRVMEILCAYVRENAPADKAVEFDFPRENHEGSVEKKLKGSPYSHLHSIGRPRHDIQLALSIIGRRTKSQIEIERTNRNGFSKPYSLDLSYSNLRKADLEGLNFANANFFRSQMQGIFCKSTDFSGCNFVYAQLTGANASEANFVRAKIEVCDLSYAHFSGADFSFCHVSHTHFIRTDLRGAKFSFHSNERGMKVNRVFFVESDLRGTLIQGDLLGCVFHFEKRDHEAFPDMCRGVKFKDCRLGDNFALLGEPRIRLAYRREWLGVAFGDASVSLPDGVDWPTHWPDWELTLESFDAQYKAWKAEFGTYTPPQKSN